MLHIRQPYSFVNMNDINAADALAILSLISKADLIMTIQGSTLAIAAADTTDRTERNKARIVCIGYTSYRSPCPTCVSDTDG